MRIFGEDLLFNLLGKLFVTNELFCCNDEHEKTANRKKDKSKPTQRKMIKKQILWVWNHFHSPIVPSDS